MAGERVERVEGTKEHADKVLTAANPRHFATIAKARFDAIYTRS